MQLKQGTLLQGGKYRIERMLGQGGFCITYLGEQTSLIRKVAIKEFFMKELCNRDETTSHVSVGSEGSRELVTRFREKFVKEARNIARLKHPNIVSVIDVFEENGTAYYVMDYCEGGSLSALLKEKYPNGIPEDLAMKYIKDIAAALDYVHKHNINHLDVKPANIMLDEMGEAVLIDFGLSKQYDTETGNQTSTTPVGISEGYAPMEQYRKGGVGTFSPASDIYSLGATLFKLVTGKTPPDAFVVNEKGLPDFRASNKVKKITLAAMKPRRADHPQSIAEWLGVFSEKITHGHNEKDIYKEKDDETIVVETEPVILNNQALLLTEQTKGSGLKRPGIIASLIFIGGVIILVFFAMKGCGDPSAQATEVALDNDTIVKDKGARDKNGHEYVDLGLSVMWATCNVGANSPSDYGGYYAWGETTTKTCYDWDCFKITDSSGGMNKIGGKTCIAPTSAHDTARENFGGIWRMPTDAENNELNMKCTWTWTFHGGHIGYKVTGPNGNSIFLPAAGWRDGTDTCGVGEKGYYFEYAQFVDVELSPLSGIW